MSLVEQPRIITLNELRSLALRAIGLINVLYLHWTAGRYDQVFDDYHINIGKEGEIYLTCKDLSEKKPHTWRRNSNAAGITLCCCLGAKAKTMSNAPPIIDYGPCSPTQAQIETMAQVIAIITEICGLDINEENKTISSDFIPFARRNICKIQADITDSQSDVETEKIVEEVLYRNDVNSQDMVEVVLTGNINEEYIKSTIIMSVNKKIRETYLGKLILDGNFSVMIPDMYAFMQHAFGQEVTGALKEFEHYSHFWNQRGKTDVVAMRSPLTWRSEVNKLNLKQNELTDKWFKYLTSGIVYNVWGCDCIIHADSDFDGDIVATTDNPVFLKCRFDNLPITYTKSTVDKEYIKEEELYIADIQSFNSTIGQITNISTSFTELLSAFEDDPTKEREKTEILERLKLIRKSQGDAIDKAKGIKIEPMPKHWTKRVSKCPEGVSEDEFNFCNSIVADRKPYFFRYLYPKENAKYIDYVNKEDYYCKMKFFRTLEELLSLPDEELSVAEKDYKYNKYLRYIPLIDYNGRMNKLCHYMEDNLMEIKKKRREKTPDNVLAMMYSGKNNNFATDDVESMNSFYLDYKKAKDLFKMKRKNGFEDSSAAVNVFNDTIKNLQHILVDDIGESIEYQCDLAIYVCYELHPSRTKDF